MRVPLNWLAEYVELPETATPEDVHAALVQVGFEEEDIHGGDISGPIVVGEVLEFVEEEQSNGKTIRWCQVRVAAEGQQAADGGDSVHGIVCGARNFFVGDKVVVSLPGSVLPGPFPISARKTYGHISNGMIASAKELGLGDDHSGILRLEEMGLDPEVGANALEILGLNEAAVEINVTPDRGYAFSLRGVAREYSHSTGAKYRDPVSEVVTRDGVQPQTSFSVEYPVTVDDKAPIRGRTGCEVFATRIVRGIDATRPTPQWMASRLKLAGIRSISLPVDISNYVMLEMGQPNHAYDLDKLAGDIVVRRAKQGEKITTLDDVERALDTEDLLITSGGKPVGIAGVMGGAETEISDATRNVLIEAAIFDPVSIARTARHHKLPSEASKRFERGVDPLIASVTAARVAQLMADLAGGEIVDEGSFFDYSAPLVPIELPQGFVSGLIGMNYSDSQIRDSLTMIGCEVIEGKGGYTVTPPTWRPDLTDKWTLAEEVARIVGYDHIPAELPVAPPGKGYTIAQQVRRRVSNVLASAGHTEVLSYPFFDEDTNNLYGSATELSLPQVRLANALDSEQGWMRTSLLPGLVSTAARNRSRGFGDLSLFETGLVFLPEEGKKYGQDVVAGGDKPSDKVLAELYAGIPPQPQYLSGVLFGDVISKQPGQRAIEASWQDALDAVQQIALGAGVTFEIRQGHHKAFHPGRTAEILLNGEVIGYAGELLPSLMEEAHLPRRVAAYEINLDAVCDAAGKPHTAHPIGTMPAATQDLSLVVSEDVSVANLHDAIVQGAGELLEAATLVDVYRGDSIGKGVKSVTFALRFRALDRTLTQAEATAAKEAGVELATKEYGASIRE